ncbi:hypothetical protein BG011_002369 [Mortierella polycephala]|uniref:Uncharacterized protein n=1 Tax=Mortierella polycephala TaxID=41804 RepID=A0A9P6U568_9FUNG|nr:hypothetical protein BG011_002369 [Mortierella polycephala]
MILPLPSTIVATCYITILAILSCVQFRRSQTPLRLAECIALTWVITTIIHLGYAFYPLTRHQTLIWRTALSSVILYDLVAVAELSYYCYAVWGSGTLSKEATPILWIYWVRQVVKVLACAVTVAYLFVPLVRHHHSTGVAMIADSNTLAVGTWYLSALGIALLGYSSMFIYFMTRPKEIFSMQAQALDLCIRLTACPIFSLPPPRKLLEYFEVKYGSNIRGDNPNTMIEDGITNDPRPRRPPMLVSQPASFSPRRNSDYHFDHHGFQSDYSLKLQPPYSGRKRDEDYCKQFSDEEAQVGTPPSSDAATETSLRLKPLSGLHQPAFPQGIVDDTILSSLANTAHPSAPSTPSTHQPMPLTPPSSSTSTSPLDQNEIEETAKAARRISRRLTMEGRRDGLDILNISGLMKWSPRPYSTASPAPLIASNQPFPLLPSTIPGSNTPKVNHRRADSLDLNTLHSGTRHEKLSTISDSSTYEEDRDTEEHSHSRRPRVSRGEQQHDFEKERHAEGAEKISRNADNKRYSRLSRDHGGGILQQQRPPPTTATSDYVENNSSHRPTQSITKKLSVDNIRKRSRDALTRLQEGGLGAALSIPVISRPLSPTVSRTTWTRDASDSPIGTKSLSSPDILEHGSSLVSKTPQLSSLPQSSHSKPFASDSRLERDTDA